MDIERYFLPTLKDNPSEAETISHNLMLRAGLIRQLSSGIYSWLPLGYKILTKIQNVIRNELAKINCVEMLMPSIQNSELWKESQRYNNYGKELLKFSDRHDNEMLFAPTCEEVICDLFRKNFTSYKNLPQSIYQISWKFRDEIRPRFGVMRGREFLMQDAYTFDVDEESAKKTYNEFYATYINIFKLFNLNPIAINANTGEIGGNHSHEFHVIANNGESKIVFDKKIEELIKCNNLDINAIQSLYAEELDAENQQNNQNDNLKIEKSIELAHVFNLGQKYSKIMDIKVQGKDGKFLYPNMGCFGIGVSRLMAAIIEIHHDEKGILWPDIIQPFDCAVISTINNNPDIESALNKIKSLLSNKDVLYDTSKNSFGKKITNLELIGIKNIITVGKSYLENNTIEIINRFTNAKEFINIGDISKFI